MTWQQILRQNVTSQEEDAFPIHIPRRLADKIDPNDPDDPLARQFVPRKTSSHPLFVTDPVGDEAARCGPKSLHKYAQRVLLVTTSACAMHCRYCFRQNFAYAHEKGFEEELKYIAEDESLREVILSGGDPLSLSDRVLGELIERLGEIPHLKRLRFHTRFPIGIPERITDNFLNILEKSRLQVWFVIHCNHPRELDDDVISALKKIQKLGIPVLNQAVLLRGVNDTIEVLQELAETLVDSGIHFYYLHQLDRVKGAEDFEVTVDEGKALINELRRRVSGYAVPTYVQEIAGEPSKTPLV